MNTATMIGPSEQSTHTAPPSTPLVLLIEDQEWTSRSIESILRPKGYSVLKAYTGRQALELVQKVSPDIVLVDFRLPDLDGIEVVSVLRNAPTVHAVTPILMMSTSTIGRAERLEAFGRGVWDILRHPVDPAEFVLRMDSFVKAKQELDWIREEGLRDFETGFYNVRGLLQRARESRADALRFQRPVACIAFGPRSLDWPLDEKPHGSGSDLNDLSVELARALALVTRECDSVGFVGPAQFVIVAPGTSDEGAQKLATRVLESFERGRAERALAGGAAAAPEDPAVDLRAGFYALEESEPVTPEAMLLKATAALRRAQADEGSFRVRSYDA